MATISTSNATSPHWTALITYLCIYIVGLIGVTILGWALYHAKRKSISSGSSSIDSHRYNMNGLTSPSDTRPTAEEKSQSQQQQQSVEQQHELQEELQGGQESIAWFKYFILLREKWKIILSLFIHIIIQGFNFAVMIEFISIAIYSNYHFSPQLLSQTNAMEICIISIISFILYRFGSCILIWRLSHSVRKSTFQIIDITILYQLLKGYKKKTRNNPGRIVEYINYLNAMFQSGAQAMVQLVFLMKTRIIGNTTISSQYPFIYIILFAFLLNIYCVVLAIYEKDLLLTSDSYRSHKRFEQILTHVLFRGVDISLRIIILSMLWLTIGFIGVCIIICIEFIIIAYLSYYTGQTYRLQEMVAVILHISSFANNLETELNENDKLRPLTPATIRMKNELHVELNVNIDEMEKKEAARRREIVGECECFKFRILLNFLYIAIFSVMAELNIYCLICPEYIDRSYVTVGSSFGIILTVYCGITSILYPFIYWILKNSNRWSKKGIDWNDEDDIFGYLERNDFESAKEILDFGKKIEKQQYISWANQRDFSTDNSPNLLLKFLYQQKVKISQIINKSQGGLNILHQICKNPELENASVTIKFLIKLGFDIHFETEKTEDTPLHIACSYCNKSVMLSLLNIGTGSDELFIKNKLQQTPLHSLMIGYNKKYHQNQIEMTQILFTKYNAEQIILECDIYGKTALHIACLNKLCPKEIILLLLKNGAYSYQADNDDFYPKDYVSNWDDKERNDIQIVMKWLTEGLNGNNKSNLSAPKKIKKYVELSEDTQGSHGQHSPQTVTNTKSNDISNDKEAEKAEMRRIYGDDSDDEEDDDDDDDQKQQKKELITPIHNDHQIILDTKPQKLEMVNSLEIDSGDDEQQDDKENNKNNNS